MPRDANGNFTLFQPGNPVETDTNIESTWANNTLQDIAAEITDSLSRSGKGALTGPLQVIDELTGVPGLAFGAEPTSGLKRAGTGDVRMQVQGTDRMRWRAGASQVPEVQVAGVWKEIALVELSSKIMRGTGGETTLWFYNNTVPLGWTLSNPDANLRNLTIAPGGATPVGGGTVDGAIDPSSPTLDTTVVNVSVDLPANVGDTALTIAQMPAHTHDENSHNEFGSGTVVASGLQGSDGSNFLNKRYRTTSAGSGATHNHSLGGTASQTAGSGSGSTTAFNPRYAMGVLGQLDA